mgnify:CR=1 FL=1
MNVNGDIWFKELSKLYKVPLMLIPVVNYFIEVYTRVCALIKKQDALNVLAFILFAIPWGFATTYIDFFHVLIFDRQIFIK